MSSGKSRVSSSRAVRARARRKLSRGVLTALSRCEGSVGCIRGMPREWNTEVREPWNALIKEALRGVDRHNKLYVLMGDERHLRMAEALRRYVTGLKEWIVGEEAKWPGG